MLEALKKKPEVWIFLALIAFSIFSHYRTSSEFSAVCSDFLNYYAGPSVHRIPNVDLRPLEQVVKEDDECSVNY